MPEHSPCIAPGQIMEYLGALQQGENEETCVGTAPGTSAAFASFTIFVGNQKPSGHWQYFGWWRFLGQAGGTSVSPPQASCVGPGGGTEAAFGFSSSLE